MIYSYLAVDRIPKQLSDGVVYHNQEFEVGAMLCACGCGYRVDLLVPDSHQITAVNGLATIRPSILVCVGPCYSHYYITAGRVEWLLESTREEAKAVMHRQIGRHVASDSRAQSWIGRCRRAVVKTLSRVRSFFG